MTLYINLPFMRFISYTRIIINLLLVIVIGCQSRDFETLSSLDCYLGIDTVEFPYNVPLTYDKATSMVKGPDSSLSVVVLENNQDYKLISSKKEETHLGTYKENGKYFSVYYEGHIFAFNSPHIREYHNNKLVKEYMVSDSFPFHGSKLARPIISDEYIIAAVYPSSDLASDYSYYMDLLNNGPLFVLINRTTGAKRYLGGYPIDVFPYNQNNEFKYNGIEYTYTFCLVGEDIYFMFGTCDVLYKINIDSGEQQKAHQFDHFVFSDVGNNPANEMWEKQNKGTYVATTSLVKQIVPIKHNEYILFSVTEKQEAESNYVDQLASNSYLLAFSLENNTVTNVIYLKNHYPFIEYTDESIILLRNRIKDENEFNITSFTAVPHDCL